MDQNKLKVLNHGATRFLPRQQQSVLFYVIVSSEMATRTRGQEIRGEAGEEVHWWVLNAGQQEYGVRLSPELHQSSSITIIRENREREREITSQIRTN